MTEQLKQAAQQAIEVLQHYIHGGSEYRKPAESAITALERALTTSQPAQADALPELLREIVAYCREAGHDWSNLAEAEHHLAALQSQPAAAGADVSVVKDQDGDAHVSLMVGGLYFDCAVSQSGRVSWAYKNGEDRKHGGERINWPTKPAQAGEVDERRDFEDLWAKPNI